jgi:regulatory protein
MKVTALKLQSRNKTRVNVYLDGQYAFSLAKIVAARLRLGQELDEGALVRLQHADEVEVAHEHALRLLSSRPRSEAEIRSKLREHEFPQAALDEVLARLRRAGLVDDQAFAHFWVENRATFRPKSRRALKAELKRKGVSGEALERALSQTNDAETAYQAASKRGPRLRQLPRPEFRRKLGEYLARRGFDYDTIEPVVERVWKETREGE